MQIEERRPKLSQGRLKFIEVVNTVRESLVASGVKSASDAELYEFIQSRKAPSLLDAEKTLSKEDLKKWIDENKKSNLINIDVQEYIDNILNPMIVSNPELFVSACRSLSFKLKDIIYSEIDAISSLYDIRVDIQYTGNISEFDAIKQSIVKWNLFAIPLSVWLYGTKGAALWYAYYRLLWSSGKHKEYSVKYRKEGKLKYIPGIKLVPIPEEDIEGRDSEGHSEDEDILDDSSVDLDTTSGIEKIRRSGRIPSTQSHRDEIQQIHKQHPIADKFISSDVVDTPDWVPRREDRVTGELLNDKDREIASYLAACMDKDLPIEQRRAAKTILFDKFDSIKELINWINDIINILLKHYRRISRDKEGWVRKTEPLPKFFDNIIRRAKDPRHSRRLWNITVEMPEKIKELLEL